MKFRPAPPEHVALLERVVGRIPGTQRRTMFGYAAYFAGNKLAVGLFADGVCMKLSPDDRAAALNVRGVTEFAPMEGRVMREYAFFTKPTLRDEKALEAWARRSVAYTLSRPAASKKPRKARPAASG